MSSGATGTKMASPAPPNVTDVLGSTIQTLNDRIATLQSTINSAHSKLFGDHVTNPDPVVDQAPAAPGRLPLLTRDLEAIIDIVQSVLQVAESIDNQS